MHNFIAVVVPKLVRCARRARCANAKYKQATRDACKVALPVEPHGATRLPIRIWATLGVDKFVIVIAIVIALAWNAAGVCNCQF